MVSLKISFVSTDDEGRAEPEESPGGALARTALGNPPALIPELLPRAIFLKLSDLNIALPTYREIAHSIDMEPDQKEAYREFQEDLLNELRIALNQGSKRLLGVYLQALLGSFRQSLDPRNHQRQRERQSPGRHPLPEKTLYPKEKELLRDL